MSNPQPLEERQLPNRTPFLIAITLLILLILGGLLVIITYTANNNNNVEAGQTIEPPPINYIAVQKAINATETAKAWTVTPSFTPTFAATAQPVIIPLLAGEY